MSFTLPEPEPIQTRTAKPSFFKKLLKVLGWLALVITILGSLVAGYMYFQGKNTASAAAKAQNSVLTNKPAKIATTADGKYAYGAENDGIPNGEQLKEYQAQTTPLTTWGFAAAPVQDGLANPINVLPINEGVSNQVLAWGWGTVKPGYKMGKNNNILAAHNFADGVTYASPLQYIDVSKRPKFYQTDGQKVYVYELTKSETVKAISREYTDAVQQSVNDKVTLVTCDEPNFIVNLNPENRIVVSGDLIDTMDYKDAPADVKALFPKL